MQMSDRLWGAVLCGILLAAGCAEPVEMSALRETTLLAAPDEKADTVGTLPMGERIQTRELHFWQPKKDFLELVREGGPSVYLRRDLVAAYPISSTRAYVISPSAIRFSRPEASEKGQHRYKIGDALEISQATGVAEKGFAAVIEAGVIAGFVQQSALRSSMPTPEELFRSALSALGEQKLGEALLLSGQSLAIKRETNALLLHASLVGINDPARQRNLLSKAELKPRPLPEVHVAGKASLPGKAWVSATMANVRAAPKAGAKLLGQLPIGAEVNVLKIEQEFAEIEFVQSAAAATGIHLGRLEPDLALPEVAAPSADAELPVALDSEPRGAGEAGAGVDQSASPKLAEASAEPPAEPKPLELPKTTAFVALSLLESTPPELESLRKTAADRLAEGAVDEAVVLLTRAEALVPTDTETAGLLRDAAIQAERFEIAVRAAQQLEKLKQSPDLFTVDFMLTHSCRGNPIRAELLNYSIDIAYDEEPLRFDAASFKDSKGQPLARFPRDACLIDVGLELAVPCPACPVVMEEDLSDEALTPREESRVERERASQEAEAERALAKERKRQQRALEGLRKRFDSRPQLRITLNNRGLTHFASKQPLFVYGYSYKIEGYCETVEGATRRALFVKALPQALVPSQSTLEYWIEVPFYEGSVYGVIESSNEEEARAKVENLAVGGGIGYQDDVEEGKWELVSPASQCFCCGC